MNQSNPQRSSLQHVVHTLGLPPAIAEEARSLLRFFGIDDDVRACREIIEVLIRLSQHQGDLPASLTPYWNAARETLEVLQPYLDQIPAFDSHYWQGLFTRFPLVALWQADPTQSVRPQFQFGQQVIFAGLALNWAQGQTDQSSLEQLASQLRIAATDPAGGAQALAFFPEPPLSHDKLAAVDEAVNKPGKRANTFSRPRLAKTLARIVTRLLDPPPPPDTTEPWVEPWTPTETGGYTRTTYTFAPPTDAVDPKQLTRPEPEVNHLFSKPDNPEAGELSDEGIKWQARNAHFQGRKWQVQRRWGTNGLNPIEWSRLTGLLAQLESSTQGQDPFPDSATALMFGLVAATGRSMASVLYFSMGPNGDLTPDGYWYRPFATAQPQSPPADAPEAFSQIPAEGFYLPLPSPLRTLLANHFPSTDGSSLADGLDPTTGDGLVEHYQDAVRSLLQARIQPRLRFSHLQNAIGQQIHSATECELTTYALIGDTESQIPPIGLSYGTLGVADLQKVYQENAEAMFGEAG